MNTNNTKKAVRATNSNGLPTDTNSLNFRTDGPIQQAHDGNAIACQLARLVIAGHMVQKGSIKDFPVCNYGVTRYCKDFAELHVFAPQLGVK